jgi:uncharacterized membrane protein YebE (DUF533 family)
MFDPERLLRQMVGGALGGALGGRSRSRGGLGSVLGGGKAQLGLGLLGVAMAAYEHYGKSPGATTPAVAGTAPPPMPLAGSAAMPPPVPTPPPPPPAAMSAPTRAQPMLDLHKQEAALMVRAMIAASAADGLIDSAERERIVERARGAGDDADTLAFLQTELDNPVSVEQLIAQTPRSWAEQVYSASALAIAVDTEAERTYLQRLGNGLGLDARRQLELQTQLGLSTGQPGALTTPATPPNPN